MGFKELSLCYTLNSFDLLLTTKNAFPSFFSTPNSRKLKINAQNFFVCDSIHDNIFKNNPWSYWPVRYKYLYEFGSKDRKIEI